MTVIDVRFAVATAHGFGLFLAGLRPDHACPEGLIILAASRWRFANESFSATWSSDATTATLVGSRLREGACSGEQNGDHPNDNSKAVHHKPPNRINVR